MVMSREQNTEQNEGITLGNKFSESVAKFNKTGNVRTT
jgi:hypothetical protein